jgi:hypothetical protein
MTVAEGGLSIFDEVFRECDLSFAALAFASACADFALPVFDDPHAVAAFSGWPQFKSRWLDRTHRFLISLSARRVV